MSTMTMLAPARSSLVPSLSVEGRRERMARLKPKKLGMKFPDTIILQYPGDYGRHFHYTVDSRAKTTFPTRLPRRAWGGGRAMAPGAISSRIGRDTVPERAERLSRPHQLCSQSETKAAGCLPTRIEEIVSKRVAPRCA